jgi:hypothetical protein
MAYDGAPMMSRPGRWVAVATTAFALAAPRAAHASDQATAQALFDQGRKLMAEERWAEACPKLEESQRLDPAGGTLLHLALCREHEGLVATAWALYQDALAQAKHDSRKDRAKIAQERIDALGPRLPRIRVKVAVGNRRAEGFTLLRDASVVGEAQWGELLPVDPGPHVLAAKARGRRPWTARVDVAPNAREVVVEVPELERELDTEPAAGLPPRPARLDEAARGDGQRTAGLVLSGAGAVGIIVGSAFGLVSLSKNSEADKECAPPDFRLCSAKGVEAGSSAESAGNVSTVAFVAGGLFLTGGLVLYLTAPSGRSTSLAVAPSVSAGGASCGLTGRF